MLTQEDKQWIVEVLDERLKIERLLTNQQFADMRDFIIDGRREDRVWVKEEIKEAVTDLKNWTERKIDAAVEQLAMSANGEFLVINERLFKLEKQQTWR